MNVDTTQTQTQELIAIRCTLEGLLDDINKIIAMPIPQPPPIPKPLLPPPPPVDKIKQGEMIINKTCLYAKKKGIDVFADSRKTESIVYRSILCYLLVDHCAWSLYSTAVRLGYKTHANVKHHADKLRYWMANPEYAPADVYSATKGIMLKIGL